VVISVGERQVEKAIPTVQKQPKKQTKPPFVQARPLLPLFLSFLSFPHRLGAIMVAFPLFAEPPPPPDTLLSGSFQ